MSDKGWMREVTPGKWVLKKKRMELGSFSKSVKCAEGRKRVQVKDPSRLGIAMNINSFPGQICR